MKVPGRVYVFLGFGLLALSQSANIIRLADAHPVAITAWRLILATILLAPMAGKGLRALGRLPKTDLSMVLIGALTLTAHFFTWIWAVQTTTVANATLFLSINPVITAAAAYFFFKERAGRRLVGAVLLGVVGVTVLGGSDLKVSPDNITGDVLALLSSVLFTGYFMASKKLRKSLDSRVCVTAVYGVSAILSFACLFFLDIPLVDYNRQTWLCFVLMAVIPTTIGHTSLNFALKYLDAGKISAFTLIEPLLAGLVAVLAWGEQITGWTIVGYVLICGSVLLVALGEIRSESAPRGK